MLLFVALAALIQFKPLEDYVRGGEAIYSVVLIIVVIIVFLVLPRLPDGASLASVEDEQNIDKNVGRIIL